MKYLIDIDHAPYLYMDENNNMSPPLYKAKGFNSLVFDQNGLDKLEKYEDADALQIELDARCKGFDSGYKNGFDDGAEEGWQFAQAIFYPETMGGIPEDNFKECFHGKSAEAVLKDMSYHDAKERYDAWKQEKESRVVVGDEVENKFSHSLGIVTRVDDSNLGADILWKNGGTGYVSLQWIAKTGNHYDVISDILKAVWG